MKENGKKKRSVLEAMKDTEGIRQAMGEAVREAVREHKLLGFPIVIWRDGKVVVVPPEEIVLEDEPPSRGQ